MPTLAHNSFVEMFRENPSLAPHFLQLLFHIEVPPYATITVAESSLDQLIPIEFRADLVIELLDASATLVLAIVFEAQREVDRNKEYSWPVYAAVTHSRKRCPAVVLVLAPDPEVAKWAGQKLDVGLGLGTLQPLVIGPAILPEVIDPVAAEQETELSVLSAIAHGNGPNGLAVVMAAFSALGGLDQEHAAAYFQIIYDTLREPIRGALEALIMDQLAETKGTFPPFAQALIDRGERKGKLEGKREGKLEGKREGKLEGKLETLLRLLTRAKITFTENDAARMKACTDAATLDRWIENVLSAKTIAEVLT